MESPPKEIVVYFESGGGLIRLRSKGESHSLLTHRAPPSGSGVEAVASASRILETVNSSWSKLRALRYETEGTELPTPHPVIEPVSDTRARNGNFRCRDRGTKWAHSRRLQEQRPRRLENLADMSLTSRRYCECLIFYTTTERGWWRRKGPNCQPPTQSSNRSLTSESGTEIFDAETGA